MFLTELAVNQPINLPQQNSQVVRVWCALCGGLCIGQVLGCSAPGTGGMCSVAVVPCQCTAFCILWQGSAAAGGEGPSPAVPGALGDPRVVQGSFAALLNVPRDQVIGGAM